MKKFKFLFVLTLFTAFFISLFVCYDCVAKGVTSGLYLCADVIIPSLFPMLCLSSFLAQSGAINFIAKKVHRISKVLFKSSGYFIPVFILSLVSSYPVGAGIAEALYENGRISLKERNNMASICCSGGPAFILIATGVGILKSYQCGAVLLFCHILASVSIAVIIPRFFKYEPHYENSENNILIGDALVLGVKSSCNSILSICSYTVIFSAVVNILSKYLRNTIFYIPIVCILEVTNAVYALSSQSSSLPIISAVLGFAGFSIIFQISALLSNNKPPISNIILIRALHALLSFIYCSITLKFVEITVPVINQSTDKIAYSSENFLFSFSLLLLLIVFLGFFNKLIKKEKFTYF